MNKMAKNIRLDQFLESTRSAKLQPIADTVDLNSHVLSGHRISQWPYIEEKDWRDKEERHNVDGQASFPKRPTPWWQRCTIKPAPYQATDGDEVGEQDGDPS